MLKSARHRKIKYTMFSFTCGNEQKWPEKKKKGLLGKWRDGVKWNRGKGKKVGEYKQSIVCALMEMPQWNPLIGTCTMIKKL